MWTASSTLRTRSRSSASLPTIRRWQSIASGGRRGGAASPSSCRAKARRPVSRGGSRPPSACGLGLRPRAPRHAPLGARPRARARGARFPGGGAPWLALSPGPPDADMVVGNHVRALMATHPVDVGSSDRHTVKPWFNGRIPEAPRVVDLAGEGFPLVGGRIDVIGRTPVATLVYRVRQHLISLSEVPAGRTMATSQGQIGGYNIVSWTDNGVAYWAVSDVAAADLDTFAKAFRAAEPER